VSSTDKAALVEHLGACELNDYFERGMELAIQHAGVRFRPLDISRFSAVEVDFDEDLQRANTWLGSRAALEPLSSELG
jgi:CDP-glycerol glycerophosphotransferase